MKVSINTPCHENWDAMTPNEQGAFCLACQKTVVDFSKKTTDEIKDFFVLIPKTERVCGRFRNDQLKEISFDDFFEKFKSWILPKKVAIILFFCFGLTLYSCRTTHEPLMGDVAIENNIPSEELVAGKVMVTNDTETDSVVAKAATVAPEFKMGEVMASPLDTNPESELKCPEKDKNGEGKYIKGEIELKRNW